LRPEQGAGRGELTSGKAELSTNTVSTRRRLDLQGDLLPACQACANDDHAVRIVSYEDADVVAMAARLAGALAQGPG
jgi:hypothetical protein